MAGSLTTPFRLHYEHCRALEPAGQVQECTDHLQHPEVLLMEFFESYHQIERNWSPEQDLRPPESDELILEPFHGITRDLDRGRGLRTGKAGLSVRIDEPDSRRAAPGDLAPRPRLRRPASRSPASPGAGRGPVLEGGDALPAPPRSLNCLAELSPPLRVAQLGQELLRGHLSEDVRFDLHLGVTEPQSTAEWKALVELTRDMAELFVRQVAEYPQFEGTLGRIGCLEIAPAGPNNVVAMRPIWMV